MASVMPGILPPQSLEEQAIEEELPVAIVSSEPEASQSHRAFNARSGFWARFAEPMLLALAAVFFALHFVHLTADFPNHSAWMDWAKYTDEGWYGDAAIRHYLFGHWNLPGDFNPAAALPTWPALEMVVFRFTGVSLVAARALSVSVFGGILMAVYGLLRMWRNPGLGSGQVWRRFGGAPLAPAVAVLLLATSNFCFVFFRLAILEPLLILLTLLSLVAATYAGRAAAAPRQMHRRARPAKALAWSVVLGVVLCAAVLTKTTAVFLLPAVAWTLWAAGGSRVRPFLRNSVVAAVVGGALWGSFYGFFVRPHFLADYRYLFSANSHSGVEWNTLGTLLMETLNDAEWISRPLFWLAIASILWALGRVALGGPRRNPMVTTLLLWIGGYGAFLTYHANFQPRYYMVLTPALFALVAVCFEWVLVRALRSFRLSWAVRVSVATAATAAVAYTAVRGAQHTVSYLLHPEYTWVSAARQVAAIVNREAQQGHSRLVLSISGSDMTLMTGIPSICDDFGVSELPERVAQYRPGWFATWNDVEDDKLEALAPLYRLERVTAIPAFDDPDRNLLILYRLVPKEQRDNSPGTGRSRRRSAGRGLQTLTAPIPGDGEL